MAAPEKVKRLVHMGYTESEAEQALDIAGGDMEQAVGYLLLSSSARAGFDSPAATANHSAPPPSSGGGLKPPPPPPPAPAATSSDRKVPPPPSSEVKLDLIEDSYYDDEFVDYDHLQRREYGTLAIPNRTSFQSRVSDITNYDTFGQCGSSVRSDPLVDGKKVCEIVEMGYSAEEAGLALKVTGGDFEQAVGFLLMEREAREAFAGEIMESFQIGMSHTDGDAREAATLLLKHEEEREHLQQAEKRNKQKDEENQKKEPHKKDRRKEREDDSRNGPGSGHRHHASGRQNSNGRTKERTWENSNRPAYTNYQTSVRKPNEVPKMVVSRTVAEDPKARPFCTCAAAGKFLNGGMVNSEYLDGIVEEGYRLYQKADDFPEYNIGKVLMRFGRTDDLGLVTSTVKVGTFKIDDLHGEAGLRQLLSDVRNRQPPGWEVVLMELGPYTSFCICLPPKGSSNKFWLIDLVGQPEFRTEGAYARVHVSLLQLEESLEYIIKMKGRKMGIDRQNFKLFVVRLFK